MAVPPPGRHPAHVALVAVMLGGGDSPPPACGDASPLHYARRRRVLDGGLFVVQGAPDLALTQFAIESLTTVLFVLVLRLLPDRFERRPPRGDAAVRPSIAGARGGSASSCSPSCCRPAERASPTGVRAMVERVVSRRQRPQRRQRDPRRLPRLRHAGRDHRAGRRRRRRRQPRPLRPSALRPAGPRRSPRHRGDLHDGQTVPEAPLCGCRSRPPRRCSIPR